MWNWNDGVTITEAGRQALLPEPMRPLFSLGDLRMTPGARDAMLSAGQSPAVYVERHARGDWGDMDADDQRANARALDRGERIFSAYNLPDGTRLWIITEWDRSSTCLLLPDEY